MMRLTPPSPEVAAAINNVLEWDLVNVADLRDLLNEAQAELDAYFEAEIDRERRVGGSPWEIEWFQEQHGDIGYYIDLSSLPTVEFDSDEGEYAMDTSGWVLVGGDGWGVETVYSRRLNDAQNR
jgi:hypothetical protein